MSVTKKNGTKIKRISKKITEKNKKIYPRFRFGPSQKENVIKSIAFKKNEVFVKSEIRSIEFFPIPKYKAKNYLVKGTVVKTVEGDKVVIENLNEGRLIGKLISL